MLDEKTILVTGAASGIGRAYVEACADKGAALVLFDRDAGGLAAVASDLENRGVVVTTYQVDVSDPGAVDAAFDEIERAGLTLDGAFLNAGINAGQSFRTPEGEVDALDRDIWKRVLDINLDGFFFTLQRTAAIMKRQRSGSIVVTGSTSGMRAEPLVSYAYIAAKSAVRGVARQAALELVKFGVRINIIAPGPFNTNIGGTAPRAPEKTALWEKSIPMGRWGETRELAALALLLVSDDSSFMTGGEYIVDGGASVLTQVRADEL
ncbi:SDR family NAD(P)-dependent oxidoreductase [soil metagenome]